MAAKLVKLGLACLCLLPYFVVGQGPPTLIAAASAKNLTTLAAALTAINFTDPVRNTTIFAPTNAAFEELLEELHTTQPKLLANTSLLTDILTYHVVPGVIVASADITPTPIIAKTANAKAGNVTVVRNGTSVLVNKAKVTVPDVRYGNNTILHVIDHVLLPKYLEHDHASEKTNSTAKRNSAGFLSLTVSAYVPALLAAIAHLL